MVFPLTKLNKEGTLLNASHSYYTEEYAQRMCSLYLTDELSRDETGKTKRTYRLHASSDHTEEMAFAYEIHCPKCGKEIQKQSVDQMVDEFKQRLSYQGLSLEQYVQFSGQNMDALRENMKGDALKRVQGSLVLEAIVAAENIEANEEDLKKEFEKMAQMYQMEASQIEGMIPEEQKENMKKDIAVQKAVEFVLDQANVTEATEELDFEEK